MRMHDICRSLGLFKSKKTKNSKEQTTSSSKDAGSRGRGSRPKSVGDLPTSKVTIHAAVAGPVFVPVGRFDPWQRKNCVPEGGQRGAPPPGFHGLDHQQSVEDEGDEERGVPTWRRDTQERRLSSASGGKVCRTASVRSDSSGKSRLSHRSGNSQRSGSGSNSRSTSHGNYNGDTAFCLSRTASSGATTNNTTTKPVRRDTSSEEDEGSISKYIDDDDIGEESEEDCLDMGGGGLNPSPPPSSMPSHHSPHPARTDPPLHGNNKTHIKRSCTIAIGDRYAGRQPVRLSHVERDRFLENKRIMASSRARPVRRDSDRQQQRPHHHHPSQGSSNRPRPGTAPRGGNTATSSSQRRKTLSSVDANEVKMIALASKALTDHVKDMTEKTRTRCCGVPSSKQTEKENFINNHVLHHGLEPHNYIVDHARETTYLRGKLLGKGGFAKCYEITDIQNGKCYACKIISKTRLSKPHQKEKIAREVELHKHLNHQNVVGFHSYFEDNDNVYIVLEHCSRKSLVHVLKARKTVTEPEVRCYLRQLVEGCRYIHSQKIVHRDLKLGNMLISDNMNVKIADFGLATRIEYDGEKKMTVCGTPNYIAPEVLQKKGHSYEADIWAMGCVMYALLLGRPPFETSTLKETYMRITANKFSVPSHISPSARSLIATLLTADPARRPTLDQIMQHEFFTAGYNPVMLPTSCCDSAPKFPSANTAPLPVTMVTTTTVTSQGTQIVTSQRPKSYAAPVSATEAMQRITSSLAQLTPSHNGKGGRPRSPSPVATRARSPGAPHSGGPTRNLPASTTGGGHVARPSSTGSSTGSEGSSGSYGSRPNSAEIKALPIGSSIRLYQLLASCLEQMPDDANPSAVHNAVPLWVTKWVDYSNKYGFGFQLSDRSVGVLFNDTTRMMLSADAEVIYYNDLSNKVYSFPSNSPPRQHEKKATLLKYFAQYMDEHLIHGGDLVNGRATAQSQQPQTNNPNGRPAPGQGTFMKKWFRTGKAIVMYLNNGTLQVNFFDDHTKVILSPEGQDYLVTYINTHRQSVTYRLLHFRHFGCNAEIQQRLQYARRMLESIINIEGEPV